jgi:hypothetical protein
MENETLKNVDDFGTEEYCTCEKHDYSLHSCPFKSEINHDDTLCNCCPFCQEECYVEI